MSNDPILPQKSFYLLRHGQSEANVRNAVAGGNLDSPLTDLGIQQARDLANTVHHLAVKPSRIYHSSLSRAADTARLVNESLNLDMIEMDNLREHVFGDWENTHWPTIKERVDQGMEPPNGETYLEFAMRIKTALHEIMVTDHPTPPLLVAHGGVFHAIARLYGQKFGEVGNCVLHYFEPTPLDKPFPWAITRFKPCSQHGLAQDIFTPPHP